MCTENGSIQSPKIGDTIGQSESFEKRFQVYMPGHEAWFREHGPKFKSGFIIWCADGSKTEHQFGAGIYGAKIKNRISQSIKSLRTIFHAKVHAMEICVREKETSK